MDIEHIIAKLNNLINDAQAKQESLNNLHVEAEKKGQRLQLLYGFGDSIL